MVPYTSELAPYSVGGLLYLPQRTVELLLETGLDGNVAAAALRGLPPDNKEQIAAINDALERLLRQLAQV